MHSMISPLPSFASLFFFQGRRPYLCRNDPRDKLLSLQLYERGMAPLSKVLTGLILPYESYRTYPNKTGKEIDEEFEVI